MPIIEASATLVLLGCKERSCFQIQGLESLKARLMVMLSAYLRETSVYP